MLSKGIFILFINLIFGVSSFAQNNKSVLLENELVKPMSKYLIEVNKQNILRLIDNQVSDTILLDLKADEKKFIIKSSSRAFDTIQLVLSEEDKIVSLRAVSLKLNRLVEISYYDNDKIKDYYVSNLSQLDNTYRKFDFKGNILFEIIDKDGMRLLRIDYYPSKGKIESVGTYENGIILIRYSYNKKGKLKYMSLAGDYHNYYYTIFVSSNTFNFPFTWIIVYS